MYGLAVEHVQKDMTVWEGENGVTCFYQSELPYDAPAKLPDGAPSELPDDAPAKLPEDANAAYNCVGYRVTKSATNHKGYGIGVYCFFRDKKKTGETEEGGPIVVDKGIQVDCVGCSFTNSYSRWLDGVPNSGIQKVINDQGGFSTSGEEQHRLHFVDTF